MGSFKMSYWRSVLGSHEEAQTSLEKSCDCVKFASDVFDEFYQIERDHMRKLAQMVEAKEKLFQRNECFHDPGTSGFYKESIEILLKHAQGRVSQLDKLLSTLDIDILLRLADVHKELKVDSDTHKTYIKVTNQQIVDNNREKNEAVADLERAKDKLEKERNKTSGSFTFRRSITPSKTGKATKKVKELEATVKMYEADLRQKELDSLEKSKHLVENVFPEIAEKQQATFERAISGTYEVMQNFATALTDHGIAQQGAAVDLRSKRTSVEIRKSETNKVYSAFDRSEECENYDSSDSFDKTDIQRKNQASLSGEPYLQTVEQEELPQELPPEDIQFEALYDFDGSTYGDNYISMKQGDEITKVGDEVGGWREATVKGQHGLVPAAYVKQQT